MATGLEGLVYEVYLNMIQDTITTTGTGVISGFIAPGLIKILFPGAWSENDSV